MLFQRSAPITEVRQTPPSPTVPPGRWLTLARMIWIVVTLLTLGLSVSGIPFGMARLAGQTDQRALLDLNLTMDEYTGFLALLNQAMVLIHILIAAIIFQRRSNDWIALLVSFTLVTNGAVIPLSYAYSEAVVHPARQVLVQLVIYLGLVSSITLLYMFPNGRFIPGWTRLLALLWAILTFITVFAPEARLSLGAWPLGLQILALLVWSGVGVFGQIYRYWNFSGPVQRQQTKWALVGLSATVVGPAIMLLGVGGGGEAPAIPNIFYQRVGASFFTFPFLFRTLNLSLFRVATIVFPLSFAIAILRYRLWDIDVIINRTMVYGSLTGSLLVMYGFSVLILSNLFQAFTGQGQFAVVVSTLGIAALFNPLRRRLQATIDRQFYRRKYDAEKALAAFGHSLRDEVDLDSLTDAMLDVIEETMEPAHISCWLRRTNR